MIDVNFIVYLFTIKLSTGLKCHIPNLVFNLYNIRRRRGNSMCTRTLKFRDSFFPDCSNSSYHISSFIKRSSTLNIFKKRYMTFFEMSCNPISPKGIKYLTRLRVGLSHQRAHKYHHNFRDTVNPFCSCDNNDIGSTEHYLLHCPTYLNIRHVLFERLRQIISLVTLISSKYTCDLLLYGNPNYDSQTNKIIIESTIEYMILSKRFDLPLLCD